VSIEEDNYDEKHISVTGFCGQHITVLLMTQKLTYFTNKDWFHLSGYTNAQNSKYWSNINPRKALEVPLHDQKIGV
jgi:hypothetical protein